MNLWHFQRDIVCVEDNILEYFEYFVNEDRQWYTQETTGPFDQSHQRALAAAETQYDQPD